MKICVMEGYVVELIYQRVSSEICGGLWYDIGYDARLLGWDYYSLFWTWYR